MITTNNVGDDDGIQYQQHLHLHSTSASCYEGEQIYHIKIEQSIWCMPTTMTATNNYNNGRFNDNNQLLHLSILPLPPPLSVDNVDMVPQQCDGRQQHSAAAFVAVARMDRVDHR
jgi:hypothetical protein